jgi:hypothetical protein
MEFDNPTLIAVVSALIAAFALIWAMFTHFSTRKVSKLTYEVSQLSDFGVPKSFLADMPHSPIAVTVTSRGNKGTENIILQLKTKSKIENYEVSPSSLPVTRSDNELSIQSVRLNPSQQIKLFIRCNGEPSSNQISELDLSHSEGAGINESEIHTISVSLMGIEFEYNPRELKTSLVRIGPISFR